MTQKGFFSNSLLHGYEMPEQTQERITGSGYGCPARDLECPGEAADSQGLRVTLAVAGFKKGEPEVKVENSQLIKREKHIDDSSRKYLYRDIAARRFQPVFALADGMQVVGATRKKGLLPVDLDRPVHDRKLKNIAVDAGNDCTG